jgi:phosphoglucomutase
MSLSCNPCVKTMESLSSLFCSGNVRYTDPVDGSTTSKQGLVLSFEDSHGESARVVFRLSGTGSAGATIRMYLEKFERDTSKHGEAAPVALKSLADRAIGLVRLVELTGRESPSVIT